MEALPIKYILSKIGNICKVLFSMENMYKESSRVQCQNPTYIVEFFGIKVLFDLNLY